MWMTDTRMFMISTPEKSLKWSVRQDSIMPCLARTPRGCQSPKMNSFTWDAWKCSRGVMRATMLHYFLGRVLRASRDWAHCSGASGSQLLVQKSNTWFFFQSCSLNSNNSNLTSRVTVTGCTENIVASLIIVVPTSFAVGPIPVSLTVQTMAPMARPVVQLLVEETAVGEAIAVTSWNRKGKYIVSNFILATFFFNHTK